MTRAVVSLNREDEEDISVKRVRVEVIGAPEEVDNNSKVGPSKETADDDSNSSEGGELDSVLDWTMTSSDADVEKFNHTRIHNAKGCLKKTRATKVEH